ncbi:HipA domain-containing protein [Chitinophaga sp. MM2321]|uniref:HipA domain-containing protein n=1 Tax=Chitinophaga sp. MM2321 TaxID=3137178 RepID=UPI0032D58D36
MKENRCLYCYLPLSDEEKDFHPRCSKMFFGTPTPPALDYDNEQMKQLAKEIVIKSIAVTGVQPKLSLNLEKKPDSRGKNRLTIVGMWGDFILKPPTQSFPSLPENEDLTMHLSQLMKIPTATHSLIRLKSGELAYLTKRFDRDNGNKLALEDMCQLTETLTEDKYRSSMEKVGKIINAYSGQPGIDIIQFFDLTLFCFLTGNADMHLKNFSLLTDKEQLTRLAPVYDLLSTHLAMPADKEEMALTLNARKNKIKKGDFDSLARNLGINEKAMNNSYKRFSTRLTQLNEFVNISFLPSDLKDAYKAMMIRNAQKIGLLA